MDIDLKGTLRHKGNPRIPEHYATFGVYNEWTSMGSKTYITVGVKEGEHLASVDLDMEQFTKMYYTLLAAAEAGDMK